MLTPTDLETEALKLIANLLRPFSSKTRQRMSQWLQDWLEEDHQNMLDHEQSGAKEMLAYPPRAIGREGNASLSTDSIGLKGTGVASSWEDKSREG